MSREVREGGGAARGAAGPTPAILEGWGGASRAASLHYRPRSPEEVAWAQQDAAARGLTVVHRGAGMSYGDATLNQGGATLDTTALRRVLEMDVETGRVRVEAGVTVEDLWREALPHGWWPAVVPGTMKVTVAGCVAMDVHGKNHLPKGSFGEHVRGLTLLEPGRGPLALEAGRDDLALAGVIGAQGLTGTILDVTLQMQRVRSGFLEVEALATPDLAATLEALERAATSAYAVAWTDCLARGGAAGRSVLHFAGELPADHPLSGRGLSLEAQFLPPRILGVLPRSWAWRALLPFTSDRGLALLNLGRYASGRLRSGSTYVQSHVAFHFLLDYVPEWRRVYRPHGFIQYQLFVPHEAGSYALGEALRLQRESGVHAWLGVLKRHRAGRFAAPYAVDGYSLALDFPLRPRRLPALMGLCRSYDDLLGEVGGRVYAAKDAVSAGALPERRHPLFSSNLVRRWERARGHPAARPR